MKGQADVLREEGRKVRDACVKVKIIGKPDDKRRYTWQDAVERLRKCYTGKFMGPSGNLRLAPPVHCLFPDPDRYDYFESRQERTYAGITYDILDIHDALEKIDEIPFVKKYTSIKRTGRGELNKLIDKRRADIIQEYEEASAINPDARRKYSWHVAQRRVRNCFGGNFAHGFVLMRFGDPHVNGLYSIIDIYDAVCKWQMTDWESFQKFTDEEGPGAYEQKMLVEEHLSVMEKEYHDTKRSLKQYSKDEAA